MVGLTCLIRVVFSRLLLLLFLLSLYKKKNKLKKVESPVMSFGIDIGDITKMRCEVSVRTPLGKKLTCERIGCHGKTRRTEGYMQLFGLMVT
jgi:hypothetical protein